MLNYNLRSKFLGGIIGSALGDAIGEIAFRFSHKNDLLNQIKKNTVLEYTDDTAMAIGIAETIISTKNSWNTQKMGKIFHKNYSKEPYRGYASGPPSIFHTVKKSNKEYNEVAKTLFGGDGSYGNGASMRITPLGLFYFDESNLYELAKMSSIVTHTHPLGIDGAALLAKLIAIMVTKHPGDLNLEIRLSILNQLIDYCQTVEYKKRLNLIKKLLSENERLNNAEQLLGSGVLSYTSVPFSIYSFLKSPESYQKNILKTVLISRDRDTVGAMIGGLSGSYLGIEAIPNEWIQKLENIEYIKELAENLFKLKQDIN